ncbi:MAG: hypothetical protein IJI05_03210 [Erysipelotrichaceae bacterium]|nr:hypothetical protein [Erysipelotrichaceae bacterium]
MKKHLVIYLLLLSVLSGCAQSHSHQWQDANYQQPSTCSICHETRGLPLEADFVSDRINQFINEGESKTYVTCCDEEDLPAEGVFTVVSHTVFNSDDIHPEVSVYRWHTVVMEIAMEDQNANDYGFRYNFFITDYYSISDFELSYHSNEDGSNGFTVNYNGHDYDKCLAQITTSSTNWQAREDHFIKTVTITMNILIPENYDGIVVGVRNSALDTEGKYLFNEYYNENDFILYRLEEPQ